MRKSKAIIFIASAAAALSVLVVSIPDEQESRTVDAADFVEAPVEATTEGVLGLEPRGDRLAYRAESLGILKQGEVDAVPSMSGKQMELSLRAGLLTGNQLGRSLEDASLELAKKDSIRSVSHGIEDRAALVCGFGDFDTLMTAMANDAEAADIVVLYDAALEACVAMTESFEQEWDKGLYIETWNAAVDDRNFAAWVEGYPELKQGEYRFINTVRIGERCYALHYTSHHYPNVDAKFANVRILKERLLARRKR